MLDLLPVSLWSDRNATFLNPFTKSGVFLREIAKRLLKGLADEIPDRQQRINHIFRKQLYGIAVTELTSLLTRRSVYCSKRADGEYSIVEGFNDAAGHIKFERVDHTWKKGKCIYCRAKQSEYDRDEELETYAYQFIHTNKPEELFNMRFDVIIGNPPYQLSDGGHGRSASPIYQLFVEQAKRMNPRYLSMIIPARWFGGGKGLNEFRKSMLNDSRTKKMVDYIVSSDVFPGVDISGGICYFLWDREYEGDCSVTTIRGADKYMSKRPLNEFETFIRYGVGVSIVRKVKSFREGTLNDVVSSRKPFGVDTTTRPESTGELQLRWQKGEGNFPKSKVSKGHALIDKWKVVTSYVSTDHGGQPGVDGKLKVFGKILVLPPNTICNETYIVVGAFESRVEANNLVSYMRTKFFRFLLSLFMYSHHITKNTYQLVPTQNFNQAWSDAELFKKYGLTDQEKSFIESSIK
jgi:site-specific DNA-methyltransferase (adenine-specific)